MAKIDNKSIFYYDTYPKIVPCGKKSKITIKPKLRLEFEDDQEYSLIVNAMMERETFVYNVFPENGMIVFRHEFTHEQEYAVKIYHKGDETDRMAWISIVYLYCVAEDLYSLRPYKGDFHAHSQRSDGRESPAGVCALARMQGLDFFALTDHHLYNPSVEAKKAYDGAEIDIKIFNGEEVHYQQYGHIIAFGGEYGLGEKYDNEEYMGSDEYRKALNKFEDEHKDELEKLPQSICKQEYIRWRQAVEEIRKTGGIAILAHPFWITAFTMYNFGHNLYHYLYENRLFDAFELLNGENGDTNALQTAYWQQARGEGNCMPIVSGTDSHTMIYNMYFPGFFTVVYTNGLELSDIKEAVLKGRSVVLNTMTMPDRTTEKGDPIAYGEFRLVAYTLYLTREVFPLHDELCRLEGRLMADYIAGEKDAQGHILLIKGQIEKLYNKLWKAAYI